MEKYNLTQTGPEVQEILDGAAMLSDVNAEKERAEAAEQQEAETRAGADATLRGLIDNILLLIPSAASELNQLADKQYVAESITGFQQYVIDEIIAHLPEFKGQFTSFEQLELVDEPKAGDIGIVRTKDTDGHDVFTFYQYKDDQWNEFYSLSYHPQRKPASTGLVGEAPYNGMGRIELPMNWVEGWPNDTWLYYPYNDIVYLMYYWNGQMYAVYNAGTQEGLGLDDNLVVKPLDYNIADIQDFVGERYLPFTESSGVWTITKPDDSTITSTELNNTNIYNVNDPTHLGINVLTQAMINRPNTIYVIQYDFTLGEDITVPKNCILEFDGGSLKNGTIVFNDTYIEGTPVLSTDCMGIIKNNEVNQQWFESVDNFFQFISNVSGFHVINCMSGIYNCTGKVDIRTECLTINGNGAEFVYNDLYTDSPYWTVSSKEEVIASQSLPIPEGGLLSGALEITVTNPSIFNVGDVVSLKDEHTSSFAKCGSRNYREGEYATIKGVQGSKIVLAQPLKGNYKHDGECYIHKIDIVPITINDLTVKLDANIETGNVRGLVVKYASLGLYNVEVDGFLDNLSACYCYNGFINDCNATSYEPVGEVGDNYALIIVNSQNINVQGGRFCAGNHGVSIGGYYTGEAAIINRDIVVENVDAYSWRIGLGIDCHGDSQDITFQNNRSNGITFSGSRISLLNNNCKDGYIYCPNVVDVSHKICGNIANQIWISYYEGTIDGNSNTFPIDTEEALIVENNVFDDTLGGNIAFPDAAQRNQISLGGYLNSKNTTIRINNNSIKSDSREMHVYLHVHDGVIEIKDNKFVGTQLKASCEKLNISKNIFDGGIDDVLITLFSVNVLETIIDSNSFYNFLTAISYISVDPSKPSPIAAYGRLTVKNNYFYNTLDEIQMNFSVRMEETLTPPEERRLVVTYCDNIWNSYDSPRLRIHGADKIYLGTNLHVQRVENVVNREDFYDINSYTNELVNFGALPVLLTLMNHAMAATEFGSIFENKFGYTTKENLVAQLDTPIGENLGIYNFHVDSSAGSQEDTYTLNTNARGGLLIVTFQHDGSTKYVNIPYYGVFTEKVESDNPDYYINVSRAAAGDDEIVITGVGGGNAWCKFLETNSD